jgi:hypothetical protein
VLLAGALLVGATGASAGEAGAPEAVVFAGLEPVSDGELASARGRAVLPDGLNVEVSVLMRLLVDGHELERAFLQSAGVAVPVQMAGFPFASGPAPLENALNDIALEHYQEINFTISNLPIDISPGRFMPRSVVSAGLIP